MCIYSLTCVDAREREIVIQIVDAGERDIVDVRERDWASEGEQMLVDGHICTKNIHFFTQRIHPV